MNETEVSKDGFRSELVEPEDIERAMTMNKDELKNYALTRFNKKLDLMSKKISVLRSEVVLMIREVIGEDKNKSNQSISKESNEKEKQNKLPEFIFNPKNRRVLEYTELLGKREDLIPCWIVDKNNNRL